jgi:hypothetical protein
MQHSRVGVYRLQLVSSTPPVERCERATTETYASPDASCNLYDSISRQWNVA